MFRPHFPLLIMAALLTLTPVAALSQRTGMGGGMGAGGSMPGGMGSRMGGPGGMAGGMSGSPGMSGASEERRMRAEVLQRAHRDLLDFDSRGNLIVRNEIVGIGISEQGLRDAQAAGFSVRRQETFQGLDTGLAVLTAPPGMSYRKALKKLQAIEPAAAYDLNHIYFSSGNVPEPVLKAAVGQVKNAQSATGAITSGLRIGLVDGGVEPSHPALRSFTVHIQGFGGIATPSAHGTAVASRLVAGFASAAPSSPDVHLYVADVYCELPTGGSTAAVIQGIAWLVQEGVPVINVSLVGPPNALLQRIVGLAAARGHLIVAAVGNDGPSAPPLYPAAYPGVIAVTGVDRTQKVLVEAGRGNFVAFAAPGADIEAASLPRGFAPVRGTSYAAPIVASRLALLLDHPDHDAAERAINELAASAIHLGGSGRTAVYGYGCIGCPRANTTAGASASH